MSHDIRTEKDLSFQTYNYSNYFLNFISNEVVNDVTVLHPLSDANAELSNEATNAIPQNQREFKQKFFEYKYLQI